MDRVYRRHPEAAHETIVVGMMQRRTRMMAAAALAVVLGLVILVGPGFVERELNVLAPHEPWPVSETAAALHQQSVIADLHADTFLWDRDPRERADRGHVDLVRLREGNVAVQVFAVVTKSPAGQNYDANTAGSEKITPAGVALSIRRAVEVVGEDQVALGSDWDGSTTVTFDASELTAPTQALLGEGLAPDVIHKVMGENLVEFLAKHLPETEEERLTFADESNDNVQSLR